MSKKQKIWLGVFLAMFIIPDLLWSPVGNFGYELYKSHYGNTYPFRNNFLQDSDNVNMLSTVLFIQMLGLFSSAVCLVIINKSVKNKWLLWLSVIILLFASVIVFYLFGFSIKLRSFGF